MFTQDTLDFLVENRLNDSKKWYDEHKSDFKRLVQEPFIQLITDLAPTMLKIDGNIIVEPKTDRTLSRVYRDTRFRNDKSKYRDSMWLYFKRNKNLYPGYPSYYFEIKPIYTAWGCGFFLEDSVLAASFRKMILDRDPAFLEAKKMFEAQNRFEFDTYGRLRKTKFPDEPEDIRMWLDLKSVYLSHTDPNTETAFRENLAETLRLDFKLLEPLYKFLCIACERKITPTHLLER